MIEICDGCLQSFFNAHPYNLPNYDTPDFKYALNLCKTAVNVTKLNSGIDFLLTHSEGRKLLRGLVKLVPKNKCSEGEVIKL